MNTGRRRFLTNTIFTGIGTAAGGGVLFGQDKQKSEPNIAWQDVSDWGVEGQGWAPDQLARRYDRLPKKAEKIVRPAVWNLSRHSAGMLTRFQTDARTISVRYQLLSANVAMPHMPATGVSGIDLYALDTKANWRWASVFRPKNSAEQQGTLISGIEDELHAFTAYLPLYNGVEKIEIGVPHGAKFEPIAPRKTKPILFYGTSITHGACASRTGMTHPAILGRRLDKPVINLGFSGNGKMEPEVGALLSELDPAVFVIDCLPNMVEKEITERAAPLVRQIRRARPNTPIVLVEDRTYDYAWIKKTARERHRTSRAALIRAYDSLVSDGVKNLHYLEGAKLLGDDGEGTTDGSHPNNLGFMRQADQFEPVLRKVLG